MRIAVLIGAILSVASSALAECDCGYPTRCQTPCQKCAQQKICVKVPHQIECVPRQESAPQPESGAFASPPRTGTAVGESSGASIEGLGIRIPAMTLRLPTLDLPHFSRTRRESRMILDQAEAPFVRQPRREFSLESPESGQPESGRPTPEAGRPCDMSYNEAQQLHARIAQLEAHIRQTQTNQVAAPPPPSSAPSPNNPPAPKAGVSFLPTSAAVQPARDPLYESAIAAARRAEALELQIARLEQTVQQMAAQQAANQAQAPTFDPRRVRPAEYVYPAQDAPRPLPLPPAVETRPTYRQPAPQSAPAANWNHPDARNYPTTPTPSAKITGVSR